MKQLELMGEMQQAVIESPTPEDLANVTPAEGRRLIASGRFTRGTAGMASGYVQGNVVILPERFAFDFLAYCHANPKPCPLLAVSEVGNPHLPTLGDVDIRTDVPCYAIYRNGVLDDELTGISELWRDDFVTFVLGCSLSFEGALLEEGIPLRHVERGEAVPMFRTNVPTRPVGPFEGPLVVSMRPMKPSDAIRAIQITSNFPAVHGAPVHLAAPDQIGIADITRQDWGGSPIIHDGEIPVFWACGVTPQVAIERARPEICIAHKPGCMLLTDLSNRSLGAR